MPNLAYLSLGSNIEPEKNLCTAVQLLTQAGTVRAVSCVWETAPAGFLDQPNYLNAAILLETEFTAETLKTTVLQPIEQTLHRVRDENPNAPRTIDIDIALFNEEIFTLGKRQIPDPDILTRAFVAISLAEIAPQYRHPVTGQTLAEIAGTFDSVREEMLKREDIKLQVFLEVKKNS